MSAGMHAPAAKLFVVFEGIDGSGKTTLSNRVAGRLREIGLGVTHVRENGAFASPVTHAIRELGRDQRNLALTPCAEMLLGLARDMQLLEEVTLPARSQSDVVIADRFFYTAAVLAQHGRGMPGAQVSQIMQAVAHVVQPDLVLLSDIDPHLARVRRKVAKQLAGNNGPSSRKGLVGGGLQHRLRAGYLEMAERDQDRWIVVDNTDVTLAEVENVLFDGLAAARLRGVEHGRTLVRARLAALAPELGHGRGATVAQARACFLEWIDRRAAVEPAVAAYLLGGLFGPGIDERRLELAGRAPMIVASGLDGLDDAVSWQLRRELAVAVPGPVAGSLVREAGAGAEAHALRRELATRAPGAAAASLTLLDDAASWDVREQLLAAAPLAVLSSLASLQSERAWQWRERLISDLGGADAFATYDVADAVCQSLTGLDEARAWTLREAAYARAPVSAIHSLRGASSDRAHEWRRRHVERASKAVMKSLSGMDDATAWSLREQAAATCKETLDSIVGLDQPQAWRLRERCRDIWPSTVVRSLGAPLARTGRGASLVGDLLGRHSGVALWRAVTGVAGAVDGP
jgi:dTMP kinase